MRHRRLLVALFRAQRRAPASGPRRIISQNLLKSCRTVMPSRRRFRSCGSSERRHAYCELGVAERLAVAPRHLQRVQHVGERNRRAVGHVGVPVLAGVARADRAPVLDDVRQDHDFRVARLLIGAGDVDLERAEARRKPLELRASSACAGKRNTPCSPSACRMARNSVRASGCARSTPSTVAPRVSPVGTILIIASSSIPGPLVLSRVSWRG